MMWFWIFLAVMVGLLLLLFGLKWNENDWIFPGILTARQGKKKDFPDETSKALEKFSKENTGKIKKETNKEEPKRHYFGE